MSKDYQVSKQTSGLIEAYDKLSEIYNCAYDSLVMTYEEKKTLAILEKELNPQLDAVEKAILKLVVSSIQEKRGNTSSNEI